MSEQVQVAEQPVIKGFDYRSTIRDPKTGKVIKEQHYIRHVHQSLGEFLERDGVFYATDGSEISDPRKEKPQIQTLARGEPEAKVEKKPEISFSKKI